MVIKILGWPIQAKAFACLNTGRLLLEYSNIYVFLLENKINLILQLGFLNDNDLLQTIHVPSKPTCFVV